MRPEVGRTFASTSRSAMVLGPPAGGGGGGGSGNGKWRRQVGHPQIKIRWSSSECWTTSFSLSAVSTAI